MVGTTGPVPVTVENFIRAETHLYFNVVANKQGWFGRIGHHREMMPIDKQTIIRTNRGAYYSSGVFDLDAGPVTLTLPDAGTRFMSLQLIDEDMYSPPTIYKAGKHSFSKEAAGTRYPKRSDDLSDHSPESRR